MGSKMWKRNCRDVVESLLILLWVNALMVPWHIWSGRECAPFGLYSRVSNVEIQSSGKLVGANSIVLDLWPLLTAAGGAGSVDNNAGGEVRLQQQNPNFLLDANRNNEHDDADRVQDEPSLVDMDLIDVLWRRDIDMEKGGTDFNFVSDNNNYCNWNNNVLEGQHERDLQLLTEKQHFRGDNSTATASRRDRTPQRPSYLGAFDDLFWSSHWDDKSRHFDLGSNLDKETFSAKLDCQLDRLNSKESGNVDPWFWKRTDCGEQGGKYGGETCSGQKKPEAFELNSNLVSPNDWLLSEAAAAELQTNTQTDDRFEASSTATATAAVPKGPAVSNEELFRFLDSEDDSRVAAERPESPLASLVPTISMSSDDASYLFNDPQVVSDLAAVCDHLYKNPSFTAALSCGPTMFAESSPLENDRLVPSTSAGSSCSQNKMMAPVWTSVAGPSFASSQVSQSLVAHDHDYSFANSYWTLETGEQEQCASSGGDSDGSRIWGKLSPSPLVEIDVKEEEEEEEESQERVASTSSSETAVTETRLQKRGPGRVSRDDEFAWQLKLGYTAAQIVGMSLAEFHGLVSGGRYDAAQLNMIKKIRRRGKNKLAARTCRQRRHRTVASLETENHLLDQELVSERIRQQRLVEQIEAKRRQIQHIIKQLEQQQQND